MTRFYRYQFTTLTTGELYALVVIYGLEMNKAFARKTQYETLYDGTFARPSHFKADLDGLLKKGFVEKAHDVEFGQVHQTTELGQAYIEDILKNHIGLLLSGFQIQSNEATTGGK